MRKLRHVGDDFPPIGDRRITLISGAPPPRSGFAVQPAAKLEMLRGKAYLIAVWSGKRESHAFEVLPATREAWILELLHA